MTAFQSLMATINMLLAKARQPVDERKLAPAPSRPFSQRARRELARQRHLRLLRDRTGTKG